MKKAPSQFKLDVDGACVAVVVVVVGWVVVVVALVVVVDLVVDCVVAPGDVELGTGVVVVGRGRTGLMF